MYWLQPPPYWRWAAAVMLLIGAAVWDLRSPGSEPHPFAAAPIRAGTPLTAEVATWRDLPAGSFRGAVLDGRVAAVDIEAGDPLIDSVAGSPVSVPDDWWAVPVDIGTHASPGEGVLMVIVDPPASIAGIVVEAQRGGRTSLDFTPGLVAVPGAQAPLIAAASSAGLLVTAVRP